MRKLLISLMLCGALFGCGKVTENGKSNQIVNITLIGDSYIYTIVGGGGGDSWSADYDVQWISEKDLGLKVGDFVAITKIKEVK